MSEHAASAAAAAASSVLPPLALLLPSVGSGVAAWAGERRPRLRGWSAVISTGATFGIALALLVRVLDGGAVGFGLDLLRLGDHYVLNLGVDAVGAFFGLFASILWFAASLHSYRYLEHEERRTRFYLFMLLTETATLGVFYVQDFFSLFVFFEAMGLLAYMLVIHNQSEKARAAARKYLAMTVIGGLSLLGGIWLYLYYSGGMGFAPSAESPWATGPVKAAALVFLLAGFGVKAGMVPLHVWLPDAHPAAPSPASALLSGVMIKAGAYGILRTALTFLSQPAAHEPEGGGHALLGRGALSLLASGHGTEAGEAAHRAAGMTGLQGLGFAVIWLGIATMFIGMLLALVQDDVKRTLAYSSVSQMGYILMGAGCLAFLGAEGAIGMGGFLYHVINHAFFKGCFFLAAGSLLFRAHELNMYKLGGLWRKMPLTCVCWCLAALGIMGIPLLNGFASKTLLHHAVVEAHHLAGESHLWAAGWVKLAEVMFIITSGGTIAYITKTTYYVFFRRPEPGNHHVEHAREAPGWMLVGTAMLALGVLFNGLLPGVVLRKLVVPVLSVVPGLDHHGVTHLGEMPLFVWANLKEVIVPVLLGASVFIVGARKDLFGLKKIRFDLFRMKLPAWLGVDYWYLRGARGALALLYAGQRTYAGLKDYSVRTVKAAAARAVRLVRVDLKQALWYRPLASVQGIGEEMWSSVRERAVTLVREYQGDLAMGALALAVALTLFLIMRLL